MAFEVITSNPGGGYIVDQGDTVLLPTGQLFANVSGGGFVADNSPLSGITLRIFGELHTAGSAVDFWQGVIADEYTNNTIYVGATGVLYGESIGITTESGANNTIVNYGLIGGNTGIYSRGGANSVVLNGGQIGGQGFGFVLFAEYSTFGSPNAVITNLAMGAISGSVAGIHLVGLAGGSVIANYGMISSALGHGIDLEDVLAGEPMISVTNYGTISGLVRSYHGSGNTDSLVNRGLMNGDVDMGLGNDTLDNRNGTIEGDVNLGGGNDSFDNRGGFVSGTINGGAGDDRFIMNALEAEEIIGGLNLDSVDFRFGPAVILALDGSFDSGGAAALDTITEVERVFGSRTGNDRIRGDGLNNQLFGLGGNDRLDGAGGADLIQGGSGIDTLTGGLGNDTFRYVALGDAGDVITDFSNVAGNDDRFQVLASAFGGGLVAGALAAADFQSRADNLAQDATDRFIFRTTDHTLWFDADGTGGEAAIMLADLQAGAVVTAGDIFLI